MTRAGTKATASPPWSMSCVAFSRARTGGPSRLPSRFAKRFRREASGKGIGHFFGALRIDAFLDPREFKRQIDDWIRTFRKTKPIPGTPGVLIPGDPERQAERERATSGIPVLRPVVEELLDISRRTGIPLSA